MFRSNYLVIGLALCACTPSTNGDPTFWAPESDGDGDGDGDDDGDGDGDDDGDGDGDGDCPTVEELIVEVDSLGLPPGDCGEFVLEARVAVAHTGIYGLYDCPCGVDPQCTGEKYELSMVLPDLDWLPVLEKNDCNVFHVLTEEVKPGVCRVNRIDISTAAGHRPWYSVGATASEDLERNGFAVELAGERGVDCKGGCGSWATRKAVFAAQGESTEPLEWGESSFLGDYEAKLWHAYEDCDGRGRVAWVAR